MPECIAIGISDDKFWTLNYRTLKPYIKAHKEKEKAIDRILFNESLYFYEAFSTALANAFRGKGDPVIEYRNKPMMYEEESDNNGYMESKEECAVIEMKQRAKILREQGLPDSPA